MLRNHNYMRIIISVILSSFILGCSAYKHLDESYQNAQDPIRIEHVKYIADIIFEYSGKTGKVAFQDLTAENPVMVIIGRSEKAENEFSEVEALQRGAKFIRSKDLETELSEVLGREIELPRDPQVVATYAPNAYIYFVTPSQFCVIGHLYYPSDISVEYTWEGGKFQSHALCYEKK